MSDGSVMGDTIALYVQMAERDIYFLETIIEAYDGIAQVRRDWHMADGQRYVKILTSPEFGDEVRRVLDNVARHIPIGEVRSSLS